MALLKKSDIPAPVLPKETADVPELGGEVVVHGLLLRDRIALFSDMDTARYAHLSKLLAATVHDADGLLVYSQEEWETFGATHFGAAMKLFDVARRLSGLDVEAAAKN